ncbi:WXG100 family type VII secretion target [Demequina globuliformis]|uniref:WXG100 family type VII secretion target n=1 Tax=Demequina globuliformis TaxID=676202 RepID=UPI000781C893|nr:hypothetical protein [Demequina globuliformis]
MTAPSAPALGTSDDPTVLVPGDAGAIRGFADDVRSWGTKLDDSGVDLRGISVSQWQGSAATAFEDAFAEVPGMWLTAADLLAECATALETYADAITTAQTSAQQAIDVWNEGEQASQDARTLYNNQVAAYNNAITRQWILPPVPVYSDPGVALRSEAEDTLQQAREDLHTAGMDALVALVRAGGGSLNQGVSEGPGTESSWSWGSATSDQWKQQWGKEGWAGLDGAPSLGLSAVLASAHASAWVWRAQGSTQTFVGPANGMFFAEGEASALSTSATGSVSASDKGVALNVDAEAELIGASGAVGYTNDYSTVEVAGDIGAGIYGDADATLGMEGIDVGAEVLFGAKAGVDADVSVGGIGFSGTAEGWAGAGAGLDGTFGYEDGKLTIGASAGLAWGFGGSLSGGVTLDFEEMGNTATDMWTTVSGWW